MSCAINKIDSNVTGLAFAEEACFKLLSSELDPLDELYDEDVTWYNLEPNSYSDFGGEVATVARSPIDPSRQNKKGAVVDLDASGGFNIDVTQNNLTRLMQGFTFSDVREKPTTAPMNGAANVITGVTAATDKFALTSTGVAFNKAGYIVWARGFGTANDGIHVVVSADADDVTVGNTTVDQASPPATANLKVVGYQAASADFAIAKTGNVTRLTSAANVLNTLGLVAGEWIFIGGDTLASNRFANNLGYARIAPNGIAAGSLTFDQITFASAAETSTGKTIRIWFGDVLKNENTPDLIKRRSYNIERTLGQGETSTQAEYLVGAVANEFTLNIAEADKITADLTFVAADNTHKTGEVGDEIKSADANATVIASLGEDALNTTSNVYSMRMYIHDVTNSFPESLFGYVTEGNVTINNNVTPNKAIGVLGAFDVTAGNFVVGGSLTAYFTTIPAVKAVRQNADVGFHIIVSAENAGLIYDIPLLGLGGGRLGVEKDQAIMVPLEPQGAENASGYTLMLVTFPYLPTVAMANQ